LVESQLGFRSFYCWGCNIGYRDWNSEFSWRNCRVNAVAKNGNEQMESFMYGQSSALVDYCSCFRGFCSYVFHTILPYAFLRQAPWSWW
jgi:hypothetical protein